MLLPLKHPSTVLVAGPTGCGKTQFLRRLLTQPGMIDPSPERIVWVYSEWQQAYEELGAALGQRIEFVKDYEPAALYESFQRDVRNLLVLDDQMSSSASQRAGSGAATLTKYFTQGSHHRNLTVVYIVQNLFNQDRIMRTVSLNSHYLILFKNARDKTQIRTLSQQMFPSAPGFLVQVFEDATAKPYGYLLLDLRPETPDQLRVRTNIFQPNAAIYVPAAPQTKTRQQPTVYKRRRRSEDDSL